MAQKRKLFFLLIFFFNFPVKSENAGNKRNKMPSKISVDLQRKEPWRNRDTHSQLNNNSTSNNLLIYLTNRDAHKFSYSSPDYIGQNQDKSSWFDSLNNNNVLKSQDHLSRARRKVSGARRGRVDDSFTNHKEQSSFAEEERKQTESKSQIDHIISGIVKLLKGNVKLKAPVPDSPNTKLTTYANGPDPPVIKTRINNRGPPRLPGIPFKILEPELEVTRPPVHSSSSFQGSIDVPFVANTKPPFLIPFPHNVSPIPIKDRPIVTGVPIPEDLFNRVSTDSHLTTESELDSTTIVLPSFTSLNDAIVEEQQEITSQNAILKSDAKSPHDISSTRSTPGSSTTLTSMTQQLLSSKANQDINSANMNDPSSTFIPIQITKTYISTTKPIPSSSAGEENIDSSMFSSTLYSVSTKDIPLDSSFITLHAMSKSSTSYSSTSTKPVPVHPSIPSLLPMPIHSVEQTGHPGEVFPEDVGSTYTGELITANNIGSFDQQPSVFDVTVSALQGYGGGKATTMTRLPPVKPFNKYNRQEYKTREPLVTSQSGASPPKDGSVYIDGRKTYFDLHPATAATINQAPNVGIGTVIPEEMMEASNSRTPNDRNTRPPFSGPRPSRPPIRKRPPLEGRPPKLKTNNNRPSLVTKDSKPLLEPPRRIDTCIVGYDTTCNEDLGEVCRTEGDVSSCFCRAGTARRRHRTKCQKSVLLHLSMKVDRVGARRIIWGMNYVNPKSKEYKELYHESSRALDSAFSQAKGISELYLDSHVNKFYSLGGRVIVNSSVHLLHTPQTITPGIRVNLQRHLIKVIQSNQNFIGESKLAVEGPLNPIPDVSDVNECFDPSLHDCAEKAVCTNVFGSYSCECENGFSDRYPDDPDKSGRFCDSCPRDFCNKRGECRIEEGVHICKCEDSFYGNRCELDGEVIAVAVGASVAAVIIIIITLIFLCLWSQRWKAQDQKTEFMFRQPGGIFGGFLGRRASPQDVFSVNVPQKGGAPTAANYGVSLEDRIRWAQLADTMSQANIYSKNTQTNPKPGFKNWGSLKDILGGLFYRRSNPQGDGVVPRLTPEEALTLHQMITQQRLKNASGNAPEQMRSTSFYQEQRKGVGSIAPSEYGVGESVSGGPSIGMHHMHPPSFYPPHGGGGGNAPSSHYAQYGPTPSIGGISRATTIGARTPLPIQDLLGGALIGPAGGGVAAKKDGYGGALLMDSSEEEPERPYHLPRPKSRSSALDNDDIYFEPDDVKTAGGVLPPRPTKPPPPVPYFYYDQFYKNNIP